MAAFRYLKLAQVTFLDLSHIGDDFSNYGNAGTASQDLTPFGNQLFLDVKQYLIDWSAGQPGPTTDVSFLLLSHA